MVLPTDKETLTKPLGNLLRQAAATRNSESKVMYSLAVLATRCTKAYSVYIYYARRPNERRARESGGAWCYQPLPRPSHTLGKQR